eukprot:TRINITY_DN11246_c0_g1_i1.p1 TRINITY_DN11246_c0_g1~~TRINITY_DN11246_c0_g1_i1.p1  ORF type:complete len:82 (-),score=17.52 TRINITY_DN11246_c0_g1_i1:36-281(-)
MASKDIQAQVWGDKCQYNIDMYGEGGEENIPDQSEVAGVILAAGGAHKPVYYDFGPDQRLNLTELLGTDAACLRADGARIQ